ncbi:MAG TPA: glycosyltransferase family 39 protein, partial [Gemmatimonadales bacterium]|nr:glycosyltransferase family 39 protein [Gemmatimonadales bacterium]
MSPATEAPSLRWVVLASLVALGLRCYALGANSLWMDEVATLQVARNSLVTIPEAALHQNAFEPPLYFWLVHLVTGVAGWSEAALRGLSAVAGAAAVPLLWYLVRELDGSVLAADLAAGLAAVNPLLLWYAQEARPYALVSALGLASLASLAAALRRGRLRYWVGYAGFGALALLSHAVAVVFPAIAALWVVLSRQPRRALPRFLVATAGMLLAIAPFLVALGRSVAGADGTGSPPRPLT